MWDRIRGYRFQVRLAPAVANIKPGRRSSRQPLLELLEDRQLLASMASLQPITNQTVPSLQGAVIPLLATMSTTDPQTFTVTSNNPAVPIAASIIQGQFWSVGVSYTDPKNMANDFTGTLTFQLFPQYAPIAVKQITQYTNDNYYVNKGMFFPRIVSNFGGATGVFVVQGGARTMNGLGNSGQPGTPFPNENVQQITLTGTNQLSLANATLPDTNDAQFFINTGGTPELNYNFTTFGQMLTGQNTLTLMTQVPVMKNTNPMNTEISQPVNPITITSTTLSDTNSNGVLLIDASQAKQGQTATFTVTATDSNGTTAKESFTVTIGAYSQMPASPAINFRPFANPTTASVLENTATPVQLNGASGYPNTSTPATLTFQQLTQPTHGTVTNFNSSKGTFTYTPNNGYLGPDSFQYQVMSTGPKSTPALLTSNPGTVTLNVGPGITGGVNVIGTALVVTPVPRTDLGTNTIEVSEVPGPTPPGGAVFQVNINGVLDRTQPAASTIDRLIVFGGNNASNHIIIDPSVKVATTIDSGHGLVNFLTGGGGPSREHGWFGLSTLIGGPGVNQLIGLAGHVRFKPSKSTNVIFTGVPRRRTHLLNPLPPGGTFYRFVDGKIVPVKTLDPPHRTTSKN
jgi:cyclophilin family peptidyl-prolyl cis-trans isomerase